MMCMGIAKKARRKLNLAGRMFIWYIAPDYDSADLVLHVASDDKRFIVKYHLGQSDDRRFLIVIGREFDGLPDAGGPWIRVRCPAWEVAGAIGPRAVRRLIEWSQEPDKTIVRVDWKGNVLPTGVSLGR